MQQVLHPAIIDRGKHIIRRLLQPLRLCPQRHCNARVRVGRSASLLAVSPPTEPSLKRESSHTALEISNAKKNLICFGRNSSDPCCHRRCVASTLQKAWPCSPRRRQRRPVRVPPWCWCHACRTGGGRMRTGDGGGSCSAPAPLAEALLALPCTIHAGKLLIPRDTNAPAAC